MLVKKELLEISVLAFPKIGKIDKKYCNYVATAKVETLKRSGEILVVDIFEKQSKDHVSRFFSDRTNYIICNDWRQKKEWKHKKPIGIGEYFSAVATKEDDKTVCDFFRPVMSFYQYDNRLEFCVNQFIQLQYRDKTEKAYARKYSMQKEHFAMFPKFPNDLTAYCEGNVFSHTYIFIGKVIKGQREAVCGHCGKKFQLGKEMKHKMTGVCPQCGKNATYYGNWYRCYILERFKICIAQKVNGYLLLRYVDGQRTFENNQYQFSFRDYYRTLYLVKNEVPVIYAYQYKIAYPYGMDWYRQNNGTVNYENTYLYTNNLQEVFGQTYYNINFQKDIGMLQGQMNFARLLDNLKNHKETEYFVKMGLLKIGSNLREVDFEKGNTFEEILGVNKQYLQLYKKCDVSILEHEVIRSLMVTVTEELLLQYRDLKIQNFVERIAFLEVVDNDYISFQKELNYLKKQKQLHRTKKILQIMFWHRDYLNMCDELKVDMSHKSIRYPKDIKKSHDVILERKNRIKGKIEEDNFKIAKEILYQGMVDYEDGRFCIQYPESRTDLIKEGQSLNHCVGGESYYKNHISGERMIFFIRQGTEPEKPYFTLEVDMKQMKILQLYGFGDCSAPADVRNFANRFVTALKKKTVAA